MHPNGAVSDSEAFLKDVYESLRNSKYWEETLIIIVFDEGGGFHDHVAPPLAIPPDNLTYTELTPAGDYSYLNLQPSWPTPPCLADLSLGAQRVRRAVRFQPLL